jgi:hypothetical protein
MQNLKKKSLCFRAGRNENKTKCIICKILTPAANKGSCDLEAISTVSSALTQAIQTCRITLKVSEFFIIKNLETYKRATATEEALPFHAVTNYVGDNYSLRCVLFVH